MGESVRVQKQTDIRVQDFEFLFRVLGFGFWVLGFAGLRCLMRKWAPP